MKLFIFSIIFCASVALCTAQPSHRAAVIRAVEKFSHALATGDSVTVAHLLTSDATILESGDRETRSQYLSHHLAEDIAFMKAMSVAPIDRNVTVKDDAAWVSTTNKLSGTMNGKVLALRTAELMVLVKQKGNWKISAIHWSSAKVK